jgi:hypothetical protein
MGAGALVVVTLTGGHRHSNPYPLATSHAGSGLRHAAAVPERPGPTGRVGASCLATLRLLLLQRTHRDFEPELVVHEIKVMVRTDF